MTTTGVITTKPNQLMSIGMKEIMTMITTNENGERIPNIGDYKDIDKYLPCVILIEDDEDRERVNEWIQDGAVDLKSRFSDEVDLMTKMLVFDGGDGKWTELDYWTLRAIDNALVISRLNFGRGKK